MQQWRRFVAVALMPSLSLAQSSTSTSVDAAPPPGSQIAAPAHWRPCGNANESYALRTDYAVFYEGAASASLASKSPDAIPERYGALCQVTIGAPYRGKRVAFSAVIRTDGVFRSARLWIRADAHGTRVAFDNMGSYPIHGTHDWLRYTVVVDVPLEADRLFYGVVLEGAGRVWIDDAHFSIDGRTLMAPAGVSTERQSEVWPVSFPANLDFEDTVETGK